MDMMTQPALVIPVGITKQDAARGLINKAIWDCWRAGISGEEVSAAIKNAAVITSADCLFYAAIGCTIKEAGK